MLTDAENRAAMMFELDTKGMAMTVKHEDGLYRHLAFRRPDTSCYWFDLVTWPGHLTIAGDMGSYTFARTEDMIGFFLSGRKINPGYWAEKVVSSGSESSDVRGYDEGLMQAHVEESFRDIADEVGWVLTSTVELWARIEDEVLPDIYDETLVSLALRDFEHDGDPVFPDAWDWETRGFNHRFLWCCHAIRWGAEQYRELVNQRPAPPEESPRRTLRGRLTRRGRKES